MPRNRSHRIAGKMLIKTDLARSFEADLIERLEEFKNDFRDFKRMVLLDQHYLSVVYTIYTPSDALFTKDGRISARCPDMDSYKLFQDVIFKCLGMDDRIIREAKLITKVSETGKWDYRIELEIRKIHDLYESIL